MTSSPRGLSALFTLSFNHEWTRLRKLTERPALIYTNIIRELSLLLHVEVSLRPVIRVYWCPFVVNLLQDQHAIAVAVKTVTLADRFCVGAQDEFAAGECADQHEQGRSR